MAGQVTQVPDPTALLNVPASHAAHATATEAAVYPGRHAQSDSSLLPADEMVFEGHATQLPDPAVALYVPALHALHNANPTFQLAVKPLLVVAPCDVKRQSNDVNRTRRCGIVVVYVASAGEPLSVASSTTPDEHAASPHSSTYTTSRAHWWKKTVENDVNDTEGLTPLITHEHISLAE